LKVETHSESTILSDILTNEWHSNLVEKCTQHLHVLITTVGFRNILHST